MKNYDAYKTMTATKNAVRSDVYGDIIQFLMEKYGADCISTVGNNEVAIAVGEKTLSDGTIGEICVTLKPVVKDYERRVTPKGKTVEPFERLIEEDLYLEELKEKEDAKAAKAAAKAEKISKTKAGENEE